MRIGGVDPKTLVAEDVLVLPRGDQNLVFRACGLASMQEFIDANPEPKPPVKVTRDGMENDYKEPNYVKTMEALSDRRLAFIVVRSLAPSNIEWDTVDPDNISTFTRWQEDLKNGGLNQVECNRVLGLVMGVNSLDEGKIKKAREVFLLGPQPSPAS